jgi:hypothetical protein
MNTHPYYGIQKALGCVTCDNAAIMPAPCQALEKQILGWKKNDNHVRCMPHILNLVVQKILKKLNCERDEEELEADLAEAEGWDGLEYQDSLESVLKKVRCIVVKIQASHNLAEALETEAAAVELKYLRPKMDMNVREVHFFLTIVKRPSSSSLPSPARPSSLVLPTCRALPALRRSPFLLTLPHPCS